MTDLSQSDRNKLSQYLGALAEERRALEQAIQQQNAVNISSRSLDSLFADLDAVSSGYPGVIQPFDRQKYFSHAGRNEDYYNAPGVRAYLGNAIGRLTAILHSDDTSPITESRAFAYVHDAALRIILQRDYQEIQRAFVSKCSKSVIVLCGGAIEALLLDRLQANLSAAQAATVAPKKPDLSRWDLADLIAVARELSIVSAGVERLASPVREYRNLIHPGNELRNRLVFGEEEARIAIEVLHMVDRDLS